MLITTYLPTRSIILDHKVTIFAIFLLNFRSFVDNRIDFYGKTL
jgi:hypothetical protein